VGCDVEGANRALCRLLLGVPEHELPAGGAGADVHDHVLDARRERLAIGAGAKVNPDQAVDHGRVVVVVGPHRQGFDVDPVVAALPVGNGRQVAGLVVLVAVGVSVDEVVGQDGFQGRQVFGNLGVEAAALELFYFGNGGHAACVVNTAK
jgi:hypothetical protein